MSDNYIKIREISNLKCTEYQYAVDFVKKGQLHFGRVSTYIEEAMKGNVGQGDMLEGVCYHGVLTDEEAEARGLECVGGEYADFYRKKGTKDLYICCFYMLDEVNCYYADVEKWEWEVPDDYFRDFANGNPAMVIINKVDRFREHIREFFEREGLSWGTDYVMEKVNYVNLETLQDLDKYHPYELLIKNGKFTRQREWRIVLYTKNQAFLELLATNKGNIEIGSLEGAATVFPYRKGNTHVVLENLETIYFHTKWEDYNGVQNIPIWGLMKLLEDCVPGARFYVTDGSLLDSEECFRRLVSIFWQKYGIEIQQSGNNITLVYHKDKHDVIERNEQIVYDYYSHGIDFPDGFEISSWNKEPGGRMNNIVVR